MKPSVWSSYFVDLSPEEMVKAFSGKGWSTSELSDEHAAELLKRGNPEIAGREFKSFAEGQGFSFPQGHLWLVCDIAGDRREEVVDTLKQWLDLFHAVGIQNAVLHPGGTKRLRAGCNPAEVMEDRIQSLRTLAEYIRGTEMTICLENMPLHREAAACGEEQAVACVSECDGLLRMIEAAGYPNIGICLDTGHLNMSGGDQPGFIKKAGGYLKALHIADNEGASDQHMMPFGRGTVSWDKVVPALKEIRYEGLFNYEIPGERRCPLPVRLAKLDYLKEITAWMLC